MAGTGRSRSFDARERFSGTYQNFTLGTTTTRSVDVGASGTCDDTVGNWYGGNALGLTKLVRLYPGLVGERFSVTTGALERRMNNFPIGYHPGPTDPRTVFPALTTLQKNNYAWSILAKTNPSAPDVSLPTMIAELKDIPSLVKNWYGLFLRKPWSFSTGKTPKHWKTLLQRLPEIIASGHLTWRWAIAPFIRDVSKLLDFHFLIQRRMKMLEELETKGLRRRVSLGTDSLNTVSSLQFLHSEGITIKGKRHVVFNSKTWGTVCYKLLPPVGFKKLTRYFNWRKADERFLLARRLVQGITTHEALATAWELMPWSWLVDWALGIGTVISATNNTLGTTHSDPFLMRYTSSESSIEIDEATSEKWARPNGEFMETMERKERFLVPPLLPFAPSTLPFCEWKAVSILGSLAVLQVRPGRNLSASLFLQKRK